MKQTAVEWLMGELTNLGYIVAPSFGHSIIDLKIKQAKEMEKQQMFSYIEYSHTFPAHAKKLELHKELFDAWYNETYESKGSDDHSEQCYKMIVKSEIPINLTSSQTEISDEEIIQKAIKETDTFRAIWSGKGCYSKGYVEGAQWYREQLKQRQ